MQGEAEWTTRGARWGLDHPSSNSGSGGLLSGDNSVSPQVWFEFPVSTHMLLLKILEHSDRCRTKKIRCDGVRPQCSNCIVSNMACTASVMLRRKTKPRRYTKPKDQTIKRLMVDNQILKNKLGAVGIMTSHMVSPKIIVPSDVLGYEDVQQGQQLPDVQGYFGGQVTASNSGSDPRTSSLHLPDPVIKHLGRLVSTDFGVDRFAGTTTGVHFIHSAEQKYQHQFNTVEVFPQCVFRLHLLPQPKSLRNLPNPQPRGFSQSLGLVKTRSHYSHRLDRFFRRWGNICPILSPRQMYQGFHNIMVFFEANSQPKPDVDMSNLHQLYLVLAIDAWAESDDGGDTLPTEATHYFELSRQTEAITSEKGDLSSLQSLILTSIYFQLSGQHSFLSQISGAAVRLAQSLGLHRHTRRFRFSAGESEMRNRAWWCVYILDMVSSVSHGLPKLINDEDVDADLPLDCDFYDITLKELPIPLPGEVTRFSSFLLYLQLVRIISNTVRRLYTTTLRRGAVEKIEILDHELHVWEHSFTQSFGGTGFSPYDPRESLPRNQAQIQGNYAEDQTFLIPYLQILSNVALLLIHQPALTFGPEFPQFEKSLKACTQSCIQIITIFDSNKNKQHIFYLQPSSTRLIFQSALMCLYFTWHEMSSKWNGKYIENKSAPVTQTIGTAIGLLEFQRSEWLAKHSETLRGEISSTLDALNNTITLLRGLETKMLQRSLSPGPRQMNDTAVVSRQQIFGHPVSDDLWSSSALGGLNQLDMLEWSADYMFGPFDSHSMEFPVP